MKKEYDFARLREVKNPYAGKKKAVGINLSPAVFDYFKELAEETGLPYQKMIDLYLLDCAKKRKKLSLKWWRSDFQLQEMSGAPSGPKEKATARSGFQETKPGAPAQTSDAILLRASDYLRRCWLL